jgi:hypothetical protein
MGGLNPVDIQSHRKPGRAAQPVIYLVLTWCIRGGYLTIHSKVDNILPVLMLWIIAASLATISP